VLTAVELSKRYSGRPVIDGWSYEWPKPGVHLIAGANGVGKSTLLGMLAGGLVPDAGEVWIGGVSLKARPARALSCLAYCPADCPVFPFLTGEEWLAFVGSVRGGWDTETLDQLTESFRLHAYLKTNFGHMSLGTARKFLLLGTVAAAADVLILDEPSNALDAASLAALQATLRRLAKTRLILMSCHETSRHAAFGIRPENTVTLT
jgi:ABC-type multidrug transport system ATPase subunit